MTAPAQTPEIPAAYASRLTLKRGEVADLLGCSERFVDRLISDKTLRAKRIRKTVFVMAADVWGMFGLCGKCREISKEAESILRRIA